MEFNFKQIAGSYLFKETVKKFLGTESFEIVVRPACFFIRLKVEDTKFTKRIIVFPPYGFAGDEIDLLNPHPETRKARVKILGKINPLKKGFKPITREVRLDFAITRNIPTEKTSLYARFSKKYCKSQLKSWKNWFYVVKESGWGNFHSLVNLSKEWVVVLLEKEFVDQKSINIKNYLDKLSKKEAIELKKSVEKIKNVGDTIFSDEVFVSKVLEFPKEILVPILIQMLNVKETGKHENCTFFAFLLKIGKKNNKLVLEETRQAIKLKSAPYYYLEDLEKKLLKLKTN
ncbi:MAG: hypothetical protein NTZ44_01850 [Candidatus Nomurabacteria bacterium]|nr:hypothetical protein [Candidatus Nomurabacteria bacterium]